MGTRARRQEHGRRPHRPHHPPRTAHQIRGPLLPKRTRPHDQITNTTQTGSGRYRTPCGKPAAYTAEKHRSQSGRQLAKTQTRFANGSTRRTRPRGATACVPCCTPTARAAGGRPWPACSRSSNPPEARTGPGYVWPRHATPRAWDPWPTTTPWT